MRAALQHPLGITLLIASLLLAAAMRYLPVLKLWSGQSLLILLLGIASFLASVAVVRLKKSQFSAPELDELRSLRKFMETRLSERAESLQIAPILRDIIRQLDKQVIPALSRLLERHREQSDLLQRYENNNLPRPEPVVFERLKRNVERQRAVIDECVQQASGAAVTFVEIVQASGEEDVTAKAQSWTNEMSELYDIITDVMDKEDNSPKPKPADPIPDIEEPQDDDQDEETPTDEFRRNVEDALRNLNDPLALSQSSLINGLTYTLELNGSDSPLEQARALREVLVSSIEMLKPTGDIRAARHYLILHEQYVLGSPAEQIMARHALFGGTFWRYRRDAVSAVSRQLETNERIRSENSGDLNEPTLQL